MFGLGNFSMMGSGIGLNIAFLLMVIITLALKGWALWIAAKKDSKPWFIALLVLNTVGILELVYIFVISKNKIVSFKEAKENAEKVKERDSVNDTNV